ncbi:hypothetical protein [Succinivibrio dextrinosolvens]|jgi:hypothetical protein|uniref:Tir chaperone protein (CesT) family protein n=2 Tax=Succinivibrio dextrinosolvens TaxID=83771 RepID=A0A1T4V257_9GAMM|nr:hypothetical protein [Succinivibrio dextrinosolvens]MBE6422398.1 hypothetical protein [Succinivibrio dextrinosolvens]SFJ72081.1 hypothetical protein SAMN04487865_100117 [Succinivibrio dextrinosolvens]SKA59020.1 hypothetical protein SAMN02745213_00575 [Succinivibrio dextrinosolvens DSM 3072]
MEIHNPKEAFDFILKITGWSPEIGEHGEYLVELDSGVLSFFSPDAVCIIIRQKLNSLPEAEPDISNMCRDIAKLNAGLAKLARCRIVLDGEDVVLEQVLSPIEINESHIDEVFEDFLNDFDYIKGRLENSVSVSPFSAMQYFI